MKRWVGYLRGPLAGSRAAMLAAVLAVAIGVSACGGGGGADQASGGSGSPGTGTIRVKVTDLFGDVVPNARVNIRDWREDLASKNTDASGEVQFDAVAAGGVSVCVYHPVRGTGGCAEWVVLKGRVLELSRQLQPYVQPVAAVLSASVDPGGISADGRSLDITVRLGVTAAQVGRSWFDVGTDTTAYWPQVLDCPARSEEELDWLGPRCIRGADGSDGSYSFSGIIDPGVVQGLEFPKPPRVVGLLIDQGDTGLSPDWTPNEPRLFASSIVAKRLLADTGLVLAGFASDESSGSASSLPQRPVTFFPVESPRLVTSQPEALEVLNDLSGLVGGGAPLYQAIAAGIDFMESRTPTELQRVLVVVADGTDSTCGTPAQCAASRRELAERARASGVQLFLVGQDIEGDCRDPTWNYCLEIRAPEALRLLAAEGGLPLVVAHGDSMFSSPLELVGQWLSGWMTVQDIRVRLTSETQGAFSPGAVVMGEMEAVNPNMCPWYCWSFLLPFSVEVPL